MKISNNKVELGKFPNAKIAIIMSRYNDELGNILLENVLKTFQRYELQDSQIELYKVPGSLEIPLIAKTLILKKKYSAIITLGIVIKGDTYHFELVCNETYRALMKLTIKLDTPIVFGVLTVNNVEQARERVAADGLNKGEEFALAALEMIQLQNQLKD